MLYLILYLGTEHTFIEFNITTHTSILLHLKEAILYRYFRHELSMSKIRVSWLPLNAVLIKDTRSLAVLPHSIHSASEYEAGMEF